MAVASVSRQKRTKLNYNGERISSDNSRHMRDSLREQKRPSTSPLVLRGEHVERRLVTTVVAKVVPASRVLCVTMFVSN